jgi:signal transduction histidine kinase/CheY-like chemotaxis protein/AraC-like DNA-binding protein
MAKKILILLMTVLFCSCITHPDKPKRKYIIGFSQCTTGDEWRKVMNEEMQREIRLNRDYEIELVIKDALDDNEKQIKDIKELISSGIDLLIVSPNEAKPLTQVVEEVYDKKIPIIIIDRMINSTKFTSYIGADNFILGREAGNYAVELLNGKGKILEISGLKGSTPAIERSKGFLEAISPFTDITMVKTISGDWLIEKSLQRTDSLLFSFRDFDLIFAHNDPMAYGAYLTSQKYKIDPYIIGIDGLNRQNGGVQFVIDGYIDCTFLYPTGGDKAIQLAIAILDGSPFQKYNYLNTIRIDDSNARMTKLQGEKIQEQQVKIDNQFELLNQMVTLIQRKNTFLLLATSLIVLIILTAILILYFMMHKTRINRELDSKHKIISRQNKKIIEQRDDLVKMLKITEETKETKLQLLTNIYHEFKNVLTLINQPIEDLSSHNFEDSLKEKLDVAKKGSRRLLRLSEEIMDLTRLDNVKLKLVFVRVDISSVIKEIAEVFKQKAHENGISIIKDLKENVFAECDVSVIEKVLYNLLVNAINYTDKGGSIFISLNDKDQIISINVKDTGKGIPEEEIPNLFTRSYRVNNTRKNNIENYGIGLAFSKQLIQLHGGQIDLVSEINEGASFTVTIPKLHNQNLNEDNLPITTDNTLTDLVYKDANKDTTVLIVEDNPDMRKIVANIIQKYFNVITAPNGEKGYELAKNHTPDVVVSDILMPVMDGIEMCMKLKKNPLTSYIPIIILTAMDSMESNINGLEVGADAYITKPFSETLLICTINNLLRSRDKIKEVFGFSRLIDNYAKTKDKQDQAFIKKCIEVLYENIEDESFHIDNLAEMTNISRSSFYKKIKEITGLKAVDFVKNAKLQYAAKLLLSSTFNINEIAWKSGFTDVKYFSKCFSAQYECNPSMFRSKIKSN